MAGCFIKAAGRQSPEAGKLKRMVSSKKKILILGSGFGGVKTALEMAKTEAYSLTLLTDNDHFRYYPALFQAATGGRPAAASIPLTEILTGKALDLVIDEAMHLDRHKKQVIAASGKHYKYDILVIALGMVTNYFGIRGLEKYSFGIKTLEEAKALREHLHKQIIDQGQPDLNYVIIGGGPTGVELAGALPDYLRHIIKSHGVQTKTLHIDLVEAEPRLLPRMSRHYSQAVTKRLKRLGIKLYLGQAVEGETADNLRVSGHDIASHTVIWTAGVTNHPFLKVNGFNLSVHGKVVIDQFLEAEPGIYVIGDNADTPYSGMAQTALYDAKYLAANLKRLASHQSPEPYKPKRPVFITPAGPHWAAVKWGRAEIYGWLGWLLRKAADFAGYRDLEPWWQASKYWLAESAAEETCIICAGQANFRQEN